MSKTRKYRKQKGFTIIELLVANVIFSLVLLGATAALVQVGRIYYRGITTARTQEVARNIVEDIGQAIQFSAKPVTLPAPSITGPLIPVTDPPAGDPDPTVAYFCVGPTRYTYAIDRKLSFTPDTNPDPMLRLKDKRHVLWADTPVSGCANVVPAPGPAELDREDPCNGPTVPCSDGRELVPENMRISNFSLSIDPTDPNIYLVDVAIAFGDDDLLDVDTSGTRRICAELGLSVEFCAIAELSTTLYRRVQ